jgi:hypothetical protein
MGDSALDMRAFSALASTADAGFATSRNRFPVFAAGHARGSFGYDCGWMPDTDETNAPGAGMARG